MGWGREVRPPLEAESKERQNEQLSILNKLYIIEQNKK
jgi:hypothetical protein